MPPKRKTNEKLPPLIGRIGTHLKCGIVGIPNVGKSTFFNVLTKSEAAAENYPFCTIDPNESRVPVPDERYDYLCEHYKPANKVPAFLKVVDIAGLVKGAHEGQGLGNAFLSHIKACDALMHIVRIFDDDDVTHVEGDVNPIRDIEIIHEELRLKDVEYLEKTVEGMVKNAARVGDKKAKQELESLKKISHSVCDEKCMARFASWDAKDIEVLNTHLLLTSKPMIYLLNLSEKDFIKKKNKWLAKVKNWLDENDPNACVIPFSAALEQKLFDMPDDEREVFTKENQIQSQLGKIIVLGYRTLQLEYFFTVGKDEVKAWTIQKGTKAPQAAGRIHTDFEKGFIMAEIMKFVDFKEAGSENATKAAGKYLQKGRDYIVQDGDIILFKFNAGAGLTSKK